MTGKRKVPPQPEQNSIPNPSETMTNLLGLASMNQDQLAQNLLKLFPLWQEATALIARLGNKDETGNKPADPFGLRHVLAALLTDMTNNPKRYMELQQEFWAQWMDVYTKSMQRLVDGTAQTAEQPADRRFKDPAWKDHPFFDFLRQSYGILSKTLLKAVDESDTLPPRVRAKVQFFTRQLVDALSPANNPLTNPEVLNEIAATSGENIIKGLQNLIADLKEAQTTWMVSSAPKGAFELGKDLATTKGSVVFRNDMMELIQYTATTEKVHETPVLVIPPWINKYYILDLKAENSYVKWMVDQGHTVYLISWRNPDASMRNVTFSEYMTDGVFAAINEIEAITGVSQVNAIGYCIGGTLLSMTLAWLQATGQESYIKRATFLTTLIDFRDAGDLCVFIDDEQIDALEAMMSEKGYLDGDVMKATFAMLRANDMVWSYVVNNYWMGKDPQAFDMLVWNSDVTNLPAAFQSDYLRSMYRDNRLIVKGDYVLNGVPMDITTVKTPSYFLSAKDDHIAPWKATYRGMRMFAGPHVFTLSGSGHVAGVVNPPAKNKYGYWTSTEAPDSTDTWLKSATQNEGSWWTHWDKWVSKDDASIPARVIKNEIVPAPGTYVLKQKPKRK